MFTSAGPLGPSGEERWGGAASKASLGGPQEKPMKVVEGCSRKIERLGVCALYGVALGCGETPILEAGEDWKRAENAKARDCEASCCDIPCETSAGVTGVV